MSFDLLAGTYIEIEKNADLMARIVLLQNHIVESLKLLFEEDVD